MQITKMAREFVEDFFNRLREGLGIPLQLGNHRGNGCICLGVDPHLADEKGNRPVVEPEVDPAVFVKISATPWSMAPSISTTWP